MSPEDEDLVDARIAELMPEPPPAAPTMIPIKPFRAEVALHDDDEDEERREGVVIGLSPMANRPDFMDFIVIVRDSVSGALYAERTTDVVASALPYLDQAPAPSPWDDPAFGVGGRR